MVGIGININQTVFAQELHNATSLKMITAKRYEVVELAKHLQQAILNELKNPSFEILSKSLPYYNTHLYKKGKLVKLKKGNAIFETYIKEVNSFGQLITEDVMERVFEFGEVSWVQ